MDFQTRKDTYWCSFSPKSTVTIEDINTFTSLEAYTSQRLSDLESGHIIFDDYMTTLDGYDAYQVTYRLDSEVVDVKSREIWTLKDDNLYLLEYSSQMDEFDGSLGIAKAIINTFKIVDTPPEPVFLTYEDEDSGISILRPSDWTIGGTFFGLAASFEAPDGISRFEIRALSSNQYRNLQEYVDFSLEFLEDLFGDSLEIQDSGRITLDGAEAHQVVYTSAGGVRGTEIWTIRGDMAYDLVYKSDASGYYSHLGTIQRMIDSFEVDSPFVFEIPSGLNGFSVYENRELGIRLEYPDDWTPFAVGGLMFFYAPSVDGENVNILVDDSLDVSLSSDELEEAALFCGRFIRRHHS